MASYEPTTVEDDGMLIPDVGAWSLDKYRMVGLYSKLFSTGMKFKWDKRVYVDLYAGSGYSRIERTSKIVLGSPLIALTLPDPFGNYVFCEENENKMSALMCRSKMLAPGVKPVFVTGDCNGKIDEILSRLLKNL